MKALHERKWVVQVVDPVRGRVLHECRFVYEAETWMEDHAPAGLARLQIRQVPGPESLAAQAARAEEVPAGKPKDEAARVRRALDELNAQEVARG